MMEACTGDGGSNWPSVDSSYYHGHGYDKDTARGLIQRPPKAAGSFPLPLTGFGSRLNGRSSQLFFINTAFKVIK